MVAVPGVMPVTVPDVLILAVVPALLLHVPPGLASVSDIVLPGQTVDGPLIAPGTGFTVTTTLLAQPVPSV